MGCEHGCFVCETARRPLLCAQCFAAWNSFGERLLQLQALQRQSAELQAALGAALAGKVGLALRSLTRPCSDVRSCGALCSNGRRWQCFTRCPVTPFLPARPQPCRQWQACMPRAARHPVHLCTQHAPVPACPGWMRRGGQTGRAQRVSAAPSPVSCARV
jgi:hypothetical protein